MDSQLAKTTYIRPASIELVGFYEYRTPNDYTVEIDHYLSIDPLALPQINSITITAGTAGDVYSITVQFDTYVWAVAYVQQSGNTAPVIAARLAAFLDKFDYIEAIAEGGVITVTANHPGTAMTFSNVTSTNTSNVVIGLVQAAVPSLSDAATSGVLVKKISTTRLVYGADLAGNPTIDTTIEWYFDNNITPYTTAPRGKVVHPVSLNSLQLANGV